MNSSLIESYSLYLSKQQLIPSYPMSFIETRNQMIDWLAFLCSNLHFRLETLYQTICIFDLYISKSCPKENLFEISNVKLIAIACLSIATKLEEINCNFLNFFTEQVLQNEFSSKMLAKKELMILQRLNFKTNQSTCYHFLTVFQELFSNTFGKNNSQMNLYFNNLSEQFLTIAIKSDVFMSQKDIALLAVNNALMQINACDNNNNSNNTLSFVIFGFMQQVQQLICCNNNIKHVEYINDTYFTNSNTINPLLSL